MQAEQPAWWPPLGGRPRCASRSTRGPVAFCSRERRHGRFGPFLPVQRTHPGRGPAIAHWPASPRRLSLSASFASAVMMPKMTPPYLPSPPNSIGRDLAAWRQHDFPVDARHDPPPHAPRTLPEYHLSDPGSSPALSALAPALPGSVPAAPSTPQAPHGCASPARRRHLDQRFRSLGATTKTRKDRDSKGSCKYPASVRSRSFQRRARLKQAGRQENPDAHL